MKTFIKIYNDTKTKVSFFFKQLHLNISKSTGRKLKIPPEDTVAMSLFKQSENVKTKKSIWKIFAPKCSYKTLVVNMNRLAIYAFLIMQAILKWNQKHSHIVKHTDSTDIPVCLNKNGKNHKVMQGFANWGKHGKGWFFGLKMHITTDLKRKLLAVKFSPGNTADSQMFMSLNKDISGIFVADAAYLSAELSEEIYRLGKGILFAKPRKNMKKMITEFQFHLYNTRMQIEINFRNLKAFHNLITSLPKSINGYFANYIYSLLAYQLV